MAAGPVLVDSSFYISSLRAGVDPVRKLGGTAAGRDLATCGVVRCEVGRGLRVKSLRDKMNGYWDVMVNVPTDNRLWTQAEQILWNLDRQGINLPLTDVVIACCAMRIGAQVLTIDHHFDDIPGLSVINLPPM